MNRLTITLTENEYGDLERLAISERRSVREMATYLVATGVKPKPLLVKPQANPFVTNATNDSQLGQNIC